MTVATKQQSVYFFGNKNAEGQRGMREILGGKGANLAEMVNLGIPVPPGFTISTEECARYYECDQSLSESVVNQMKSAIAQVEQSLGKTFGDTNNPLLFSVRSGARVSMPGMMDTVLNLGLNDQTVVGLANKSQSARFAWDSYRRFIQMYGNVVLGLDHHQFELILEKKKQAVGVELDTDLSEQDLQDLVAQFKAYMAQEGTAFPQDPMAQLIASVGAVFKSWRSNRAYKYRAINQIPDEWGTAVNVQAMVFGNLGDTSGTGVCFTRNPSTGENVFYGEYLVNAQGEDVVAGIRTPEPISSLEALMPAPYNELVEIYKHLETHYKDMQDMEFTIEEGTLYILQTRSGKRTAAAAVKIAVDMVNEGLIDSKQALLRIDPNQIDQLLHPNLDPSAQITVLAKGLPASPGAAVGQIVLTADEAEQRHENGQKVILVRTETSPEDIGGMHAAEGILTARGGMTSHAAVVARGMGKPCVAGCSDVQIDLDKGEVSIGGQVYQDNDYITLDGSAGNVIAGEVPLVETELSGDFETVMNWADEVRRMKVRTNAETPHDVQVARNFGAEGIGLCRTEHMFFQADRIKVVREMILAESDSERQAALDKLFPVQKEDFKQIFDVMDGLPVTVRLLDPPLHEFLPHDDQQIEQLAQEIGKSVAQIKQKLSQLHELNPMLGHRGCRLAISFPEICEMQARAIMQAAVECQQAGKVVIPEIMVPLVGVKQELAFLKDRIKSVCDDVIAQSGQPVQYLIGTMIETPRAALVAAQIAEDAQFFSFGTNDLTQMTYGLSRDDSGQFLPSYVEKGIYAADPFQTLDQNGVGQLIEMAMKNGKATRDDLKIGICGEHGGDPASIVFCERHNFDYVSCSPYRVPVARLVAAQSVLESA
ncbi:MAG: pyruvate, phosphate dikinase [Actinobacteria bacterium]|nr:pyruvate, phosphate dikinase [Actinomycetota bacterium]